MSLRSHRDQAALEDDGLDEFKARLGVAWPVYVSMTTAQFAAVPCALHGAKIGEPCGSFNGKPFCCQKRRVQAACDAAIAELRARRDVRRAA